jgi:hypothetical protein
MYLFLADFSSFQMLRIVRLFTTKAKPEPLLPAGINIWEQRFQKPKELQPENDDFYNHGLYTPIANPSTGTTHFTIGFDKTLPKPLHFPQFDQSKKSIQTSGIDSISTYY